MLCKFVRFTKHIDLFLKVLGYQSYTVSSNLVDDSSVGKDCLAAYKHNIDLRHEDWYRAVIDHLA